VIKIRAESPSNLGDSAPAWARAFLKTSRPTLTPTPPSIQWVPGAVRREESGRRVKQATHLHLVSSIKNVPEYTAIPSCVTVGLGSKLGDARQYDS
jgi:hypothetical protein